MNDEKRMAGDYEIIHAMHIGDQEIVVGENPAAAVGQMYMCAFCEQNEIFARYDEVLCSDDYAEIIGIYGQRVTEQAEKTRIELKGPKSQGIVKAPLPQLGARLSHPMMIRTARWWLSGRIFFGVSTGELPIS